MNITRQTKPSSPPSWLARLPCCAHRTRAPPGSRKNPTWRRRLANLKPHRSRPGKPFLIPDLRPSFVIRRKSRNAGSRQTGLLLADYTAFIRTAPASAEWQTTRSSGGPRRRLMFSAPDRTRLQISYLVAANTGLRRPPGATVAMTDVSADLFPSRSANKLTVGGQDQGDVRLTKWWATRPTCRSQEARADCLSSSRRNIGVKMNHVFGADQRMTLSYGIFNDWWVTDNSPANNGTDPLGAFHRASSGTAGRQRFLNTRHFRAVLKRAGQPSMRLRRTPPRSNVHRTITWTRAI